MVIYRIFLAFLVYFVAVTHWIYHLLGAQSAAYAIWCSSSLQLGPPTDWEDSAALCIASGIEKYSRRKADKTGGKENKNETKHNEKNEWVNMEKDDEAVRRRLLDDSPGASPVSAPSTSAQVTVSPSPSPHTVAVKRFAPVVAASTSLEPLQTKDAFMSRKLTMRERIKELEQKRLAKKRGKPPPSIFEAASMLGKIHSNRIDLLSGTEILVYFSLFGNFSNSLPW